MGLRTLAAQLVLGRCGGAFRAWHMEVGNCRTSSTSCVSAAASPEKRSRSGLQDSGLTLAVVERELVGGECPYWGCVPSKTLLRSGETLSEADRARLLAASRVEWTVDFPKVSETRAVDGTQPRRQPACRRAGGDRGQALSRRRDD